MDPTIEIVNADYSFQPRNRANLPSKLSFGKNTTLESQEKLGKTENVYYSITQEVISSYQNLTNLRNEIAKLPSEVYENAVLATNKFNMGKSIFESLSNSTLAKEGSGFIKMANLDTIFNITGVMRRVNAAEQYFGNSDQDGVDYRFCTIADGPGGMTKYIQYRMPRSYGYGMTKYYNPDPEKRNWVMSELDPNRFDIIKGSDSSGDFLTKFQEVINYQQNSKKLDLFIGNLLPENALENDSLVGIFLETYVASLLLNAGGNLVIRCCDLFTWSSLDLIRLLGFGFEEVYLFKPCSSPYSSSERYIIAKGRNSVRIDETLTRFLQGGYNRIFENLPSELINEINGHNLLFINSQIEALSRIIKYISLVSSDGNTQELTRRSNMDKYLILWSIPSNSSYVELPFDSTIKIIKKGLSKTQHGKFIFGIYNYLFKMMERVKDKTERMKNLLFIRTYLMDVALGAENKYPSEYPDIEWSHIENEGNYIFTLGKYKKTYPKEKIDNLLKKVNGNWQQIYDLVERYFPFKSESLVESFYNKSQVEAFSSPLTTMTNEYTSLYDEDKVFGSLGKFFSVYPNIEKEWILYPPTSDYVLNKLESTLRKDIPISIYLPKRESVVYISKLIREWKSIDVNIELYSHSTLEKITIPQQYVKITNP